MECIITNKNKPRHVDIPAGMMLLIDKPLEWTSFDVVNKIRFTIKHKLGVKKFKVGHAGTLDPLATGLLLICCGKYTKQIESLINHSKTYVFDTKFGKTTPSYDAETEETFVSDVSHLSSEMVESVLDDFRGDILQKPPMFSAIKKQGKALYKMARNGEYIEIEPRPIHISKLDLLEFKNPIAKFELACSKGTYVRSLANDIGATLEVGGYVTTLRRTKVESFDVEDALKLEEATEFINQII